METPHRYTAIASAEVAELLDRTLAGIGADIDAAAIPGLLAVLLGGGYGRGEGGVRHTALGDRPYNDLDFFVVASSAAAADGIKAALRNIAEKWEKTLGIAVDFSYAKTPEQLRKAAGTLMFQELLRGYLPVWGKADLAECIPALTPEELPFTEAARLFLNRGMGLVLSGEHISRQSDDADFIVRNLNKAILGSGDALLLAAGLYRWSATERQAAFAGYVQRAGLPEKYATRYEQALRYKSAPDPVLPDDPQAAWQDVREFFLDAVRRAAEVPADADARAVSSGLSRRAAKERSVKNLLRWARRTGKLRCPATWCDAPVVTLLGQLYDRLSRPEVCPDCPPKLRRLWEFFN